MKNPDIITPEDIEENIINNEIDNINNIKNINNKEYKKEYTLEQNNLTYKLKMIIDDNENISLKLNQTNNISEYYFKKYKYEQIKKQLNMNKENFRNIIDIFNFLDSSITQNKLKLIKENNKNINLTLIEIVNNNIPKQHYIPLEAKKLSTEENLKVINNEINEMKNNRELINQLIKSNEYLRNQNQILLENQKHLIDQITKLYEKLDNNNNNNLFQKCPRCKGKGEVPKIMIWDKDEKTWCYNAQYQSTSINGNIYHYNYILSECPLCKGNKTVDITKYIRCQDCKEVCGYGEKSYFGNKVEFCKTCNGSGYFRIE